MRFLQSAVVDKSIFRFLDMCEGLFLVCQDLVYFCYMTVILSMLLYGAGMLLLGLWSLVTWS